MLLIVQQLSSQQGSCVHGREPALQVLNRVSTLLSIHQCFCNHAGGSQMSDRDFALQIIDILAESWLLGVLPIALVVKFCSLDRLAPFSDFPFYRCISYIFVGVMKRIELATTATTVKRLLLPPQAPFPPMFLVRPLSASNQSALANHLGQAALLLSS